MGIIVWGWIKESVWGWFFGELGGSYNKVRSIFGFNVLFVWFYGVMLVMEGLLIVVMGEY